MYITVNSVVKAVLGVYPQESLEPVAYLSIFLLCFCPADKAILICLNLLELKDSVMDSVGLVNAYLTSLGLGNDQKIREFMNQIVLRFTASLSVNHVQVNSSVYLMDKIISRRKIDEVAMFLVLSVDVIKDTIINGKNNHLAHNLLLVRHCSPNSISYKYRQLTSVNSSAFMKRE